MAMSKIKYAAAVLSAVLLSGCVMYSDKDEVENPQLDVTDLMYFNYVEPVFRIAELADFFDRYQAIREDRKQAEDLARSYFGEHFISEDLYYEEFSVYPMWGKIFLTDSPGEYVCIPASSRQWNNIYTEYSVKALGDRRYSISCDTSDDPDKTWKSLSVDAVIDCSSGDAAKAMSLEIVYGEDTGGEKVAAVVTSEGGDLSIPLCRDGQISQYPDGGILHFEISGAVSDSFDVDYGRTDFEIVNGNGTESVDK